ncbi:MAG: prolyl oligopeptidase family serine peptidase [Clostridiales bacterium]|nr:prolyl oligopeptidase family serine peptidase [Clostridiales bacterium]
MSRITQYYKGIELGMIPLDDAADKREAYRDSVNRYLERLRVESAAKRRAYISPESLAANREKYRAEYIAMLGAPLTERSYDMPVPEAKVEPCVTDGQATAYRVTLKVMEDFDFSGLLLIPNDYRKGEKRPLVIAQHGGGGTSELICDLVGQNNYGNCARRHLERGAVVFAPQLLLWNAGNDTGSNIPGVGSPYDRRKVDIELRQFGSSITAVEVFCISRAIDWLVTRPETDPGRIGMNGLSYGGFYTLMTAAADTRIKCAYTCACFNDRIRYNWPDMSWFNSGNTFLDAEIAGLIAPRRLWIDVGREDAVFDYKSAIPVGEQVPAYFEAAGVPGNAVFCLWDGGHKMNTSEEPLDFFYAGLNE